MTWFIALTEHERQFKDKKLYLEGPISKLTEVNISCLIGHIYVRVFVYVDDTAVI
jgi:hypothetical protein